ncbi:MAG TPA: polyprenyl diphosphate synthase [Gemmatimonadales bacterium]|jgi:undecaprenyl diphosphate synthase
MSGLHVAIIMDGNGRWARTRGLPRWRGHMGGVESVRDVVRASPDMGISTLTLYAFSQDNWKRPAAEVGRLFWLLREYCRRERAELVQEGVKVTTVGWRHRIPGSALKQLEETEAVTAGNTRLHLRLAIDYSSRTALADAAVALAHRIQSGELREDDITRDQMQCVLSPGVPMVDLLVRTAGEQRVSDFLLWEIAYAELYFTEVLWPDFRRDDLQAALAEFRRRERRFGGLIAVPGAEPAPAPVLPAAAGGRRRRA